ncbi:MAG TPA: FAD-dependent oxidoreductase [Thermoanaerobaculia bacterium]|nr:FAD-dependent oxidoreductase [Thermoanaerobaculia bacterium]
MARTPLFGFIERSLRTAQASLHNDIPIDEITEMAAEHRLTRRSILAGGAAAAAALALPRCTVLPPARRDAPVIIAGAGLAGLTAGYRLRRAGTGVRIFEGQNRTGGRVLSLRGFFPEGQVAELGGELIDSGHVHVRALAAELGITLDDLAADDPSLQGDLWFFDGARRSEREVIEAFRPVAARIEAALESIGEEDVTYTRPGTAARLDRMTVARWLDEAGVTGWFRTLLDAGFTTEFGLEIDQQSALNLLTMIDPRPDPFRIYGESDERYHVRGGNDLIPAALAAALQDDIELNAVLRRIRRRGDGRVECTFARGASTFTAAAEHAIVAIPFTMLRTVEIDLDLPPAKRRAIGELGYGTNAKLMTGFAERLWRTKYRSNGSTLTDLPYQLTWETSRLQPGEPGILTNFTGGRQGLALGEGTPAERSAELASQLDILYPGLATLRRKEARMHWPTQPFVRGSYACYLPGQWTAIRGAEGEAAGNVHFAGEHCSLDAQGFMEGGCETGERAAAEVQAALRPAAARLLSRRRARIMRYAQTDV